ncbi:HAD family hydrolase [Methylosoma difficile]
MPNLSDFAAVIFDMDGLVLDTESTYCLAWQQAGSALGYSIPEHFCLSMAGLSGTAIEGHLLSHFGESFDLPGFQQLSGKFWHAHVGQHGIAVKTGVDTWLDALNRQKLPFGLATNSRAANARLCLQMAGLAEAFQLIVCRDDVAAPKPAPDVFLAAARHLQVDIRQCLVLEDSHTGLLAAKQAGAYAAFIPSVWPAQPESLTLCDFISPDLEQLFATFGR